MKTQSGEHESLSHLPAYIGERHRLAADAGLTVEKQTCNAGLLTTWYRGSEAQLRKAEFVRAPRRYVFPKAAGERKMFCLVTYSPAAEDAEIKCSLLKMSDADDYRLVLASERLPDAWQSLAGTIEVYRYCDLREGLNTGPATVYIGLFESLRAAGIAPQEAEHSSRKEASEIRLDLWKSQPLQDGRHRFVVYHEAQVHANEQAEERGRANFRSAEEYREWLIEVAASSLSIIKRQMRVRTKHRYVYRVPARTVTEMDQLLSRLRKLIARCEVVVEKEDTRAEEERGRQRRAAIAAMKDADFQRFLSGVAVPDGSEQG
jgi:hypothetical protein